MTSHKKMNKYLNSLTMLSDWCTAKYIFPTCVTERSLLVGYRVWNEVPELQLFSRCKSLILRYVSEGNQRETELKVGCDVCFSNSRPDVWLGARADCFALKSASNSQQSMRPGEAVEFEESVIPGSGYYQNWIQLLLCGLIDLAQRNGAN